MPPEMMPYEQQVSSGLYHGMSEKTFIDKTLAKSDVDEIKEIMQKEKLTRPDLLRLLYLFSANEIKLLNLDEWDRYILGLFYTWIRDFVSVCETMYDYEITLDNTLVSVFSCNSCKSVFNELKQCPKCNNLEFTEIKNKWFFDSTRQSFSNSKNLMLHNVKFLADIFFYISRSTLSLEAMAVDSIWKNRYEYTYSGMPGQPVAPEQKKSVMNILLRK